MPFPRRKQPDGHQPDLLSTVVALRSFDDPDDQRIILPSTNRQPGVVQPASRTIKHNALAEARFFLSARAQKFVLFAISLIEPEDVELRKMYTVHASEFAQWAGVGLDAVRRDFYDPPDKQKKISIAAELMNEWIVIPNYIQKERDNRVAELCAHWFAGITPEVTKGPCSYLDVYFNRLLAPMLQGLRATYYGVNKIVVRKFDSRYAIRLFEWIESWSYQQERRGNRMRVSVDEVRGFLGTDRPSNITTSRKSVSGARNVILDDRVYERHLAHYGHFRDKALDVAVREINASTDYTVEVFPVRRPGSKAVVAFDFVVFPKKKGLPPTLDGAAAPVPGRKPALMNEQMTLAYPPDTAGSPDGDGEMPVADEVVAPNAPVFIPPKPVRAAVGTGWTLGVQVTAVAPPEGEEEAALAKMIGELVAVYGLTRSQRDLAGYARTVGGCTTAPECAAWLKAIHDGVRRAELPNPARTFMASVKGEFSDGRRVKLRPIVNPLAPPKKAPAPPPPAPEQLIDPGAVSAAPDQAQETDENREGKASVSSQMHDFRVKMYGLKYAARKEEEARLRQAASSGAAQG